jgi:predicted DNA-binding transcriptional regulator AlpA
MDAVNSTSPQPSDPGSIATTIERYGRMLTVKEFAQLTAESPKTVYSRVKRGAQPASSIGSSIRLDPYETAVWLRAQSA